MKYTRSSFLKTLGLGGLAATTSILNAAPRNDFYGTNHTGENTSGLTLGLASYSTRNFTLDETLAMANRLNI
jgi:inosose dehydratase